MEPGLPDVTATSPTEPAPAPEGGRSWYAVWLPRIGIATLLVVALVYGSVWVFGSTADFLVTLLVSLFIAFALLPAVEYLARRGWRRGAATALVMFGGALLAIGFVVAITQVVVGQVISLVENAPAYLDTIAGWLEDTFGIQTDFDSVIDQLAADRERLAAVAADAMGGVLGLATTALGLVFQMLTISLFVFYIVADLPKLRAAVLHRFKPKPQLHIDTVTTITIEKVGGYVYSRTLLALCSATFSTIAFLVIGLDYAVALGLWVGLVSQFIPTIGTYLAGALPVLIALVEDPVDAIWVIVVITVYQQIENYLLSPRITANTMDLHPAVAFGSVIVGGALLGGVGALLALPAAATAVALIQTYTDHYDITAQGPIGTPEEYEARIRARTDEKLQKKRGRKAKLKRFVGADGGPTTGG